METMKKKPLPFDKSDIVLHYELAQHVGMRDDPEQRFVRTWGISARTTDDDGEEKEEIATAEAIVVDAVDIQAAGGDVHDLLDSLSSDLEHIAATIFNVDSGDFVEDLEEELNNAGSVLILDRVRVDPRFRGHGIGPLIAALAISAVGSGCSFAVCYPAPIEGKLTDRQRKEAIASLGRVWAKVGFKPFRDGVWILDLETVELEQALQRL
jgi:GNAT superfamily N-acetyltransferase